MDNVSVHCEWVLGGGSMDRFQVCVLWMRSGSVDCGWIVGQV